MATDARHVWDDTLSFLRSNHPDLCRQWFDQIEAVDVRDMVLRLRVSQSVQRNYLQRECFEQFNESARAVTGTLVSVSFVDESYDERSPATNGRSEVVTRPSRPSAHRGPVYTGPAGDVDALAISPDYGFEQFVTGPENRLAQAAALAVADNPGRAYNPLFIHGGVGLGKTHLLQAICLRLIDDAPDGEVSIYYTSCEGFTTAFYAAVEAGDMSEFRHQFRGVDILVIDDIQFLAQRDRTQEEFFHTFNSLYQASKQIVLSSDAPPDEIPDLEARLVSRFQSGLVVEVKPPSYETRVQIVKRKGKLRGFEISDEVAAFIAGRVSSNIRELEGAIKKVQMLQMTEGRPLDLAIARDALADLVPASTRRETTITQIIDTVTVYYGVKVTDLQSKRRQKSIALPRQICMFLARRHTRYSLEEIGGYFGGRDHTTVLHAVRTIGQKSSDDEEFAGTLRRLEEQFLPPTGS